LFRCHVSTLIQCQFAIWEEQEQEQEQEQDFPTADTSKDTG